MIALGAALFILFQHDGAAQDGTTVVAPQSGPTLKERLSDKASDGQRVNDCKVPPEKRGNSKRSAECGRASRKALTAIIAPTAACRRRGKPFAAGR